jgi:ribose transport system permease protein
MRLFEERRPMTTVADHEAAREDVVTSRGPAARTSGTPLLDRYSGLLVLILLVAVFSFLRPDTFFTVRTLRGLAADQAVTAIAAIGVLVAYACGAFDLSVGAVLGLGVVMVTWLQAEAGWPAWMAVIGAMCVGIAVGVVNGLVVTVLRVNSFIATSRR